MTKAIHSAAEADVPTDVKVPLGTTGWAMWLAAKFGMPGLAMAAALYGLNVVYKDSRADAVETRNAYREAIRVQAETADAIRASVDQLKKLEDGVKEVRTQMEISNKNNHP